MNMFSSPVFSVLAFWPPEGKPERALARREVHVWPGGPGGASASLPKALLAASKGWWLIPAQLELTSQQQQISPVNSPKQQTFVSSPLHCASEREALKRAFVR